MSLVVDSSLALSWYFRDEQTEARLKILDQVVEGGATVTPIWFYEVAKSLQVAVRRKRVGAAFRDASLADLATLNIGVDPDCDAHAWSATVQLADRHGLTVYDASYLELAQRRRLELATLDVALAKAARAEHLAVTGD